MVEQYLDIIVLSYLFTVALVGHNNYLSIYDLYGPVGKVFDVGRQITWGGGGGGLALEIENFVGPVK